MIRQTLDPSSPQVILDVKPDGGIEFMTRSSQGGETTFIAGGATPVRTDFPMFSLQLNLSRVGTTVYAWYCTGGSCVDLGRTPFPEGPALIGVAVTSQDSSKLNQARFFLPTVISVPYPWSTLDIGAVGTTGEATYDGATGTFFVSGAGSDIWGSADSFRTVAQQLTGDAALTARVVSEQNTSAFAKAGVTIGDKAANGARVILDVKPNGGIEFMARSTAGGSMSFVAGSGASFPVWLRLTRTGNQFVGEMSADGIAWASVGSVTVTMPDPIEVGLAVTSHDPNVLNAARFDHIALTYPSNPTGQSLLTNGGFEDSTPPATGPGWVSDALRQWAAQSETASPLSGMNNGACRTTSHDCGIYQEVTKSADWVTGNIVFSIFASADHPGALVGVNINGTTVADLAVAVGGYQNYSMGVFVPQVGDVVRVWMYAPATAGFVIIDDATLTLYTGPR
jgi:regulation of enolase protein 1 (concanavalin A-like superfamily)